MGILIRLLITAVAVWVSTALPGIALTSDTTGKKILTLLAVAVIIGLVNAIIKPIVKVVGCAFYILTLGLISLLVNALLFWFVSWLADKIHLGFHVDGFWSAFWGAIIVAVVSWVLSIVVPDGKD